MKEKIHYNVIIQFYSFCMSKSKKERYCRMKTRDNNAVDPVEKPITFAESMELFSENDIVESAPIKQKKHSRTEKIISNVIFSVCMIVFVTCLAIIAVNLTEKYIGQDFYKGAADDFFSGIEDGTNDKAVKKTNGMSYLAVGKPSFTLGDFSSNLKYEIDPASRPDKAQSAQLARIRAQLNSMRQKNDEIFGFVKVEGTNISYTVVHHDDNEYYLNHSIDKKPLVLGSIYLDYRNKIQLASNYNSILYGHNMTSGSMFHELELFDNNAALFAESAVYVYTMEGIYVYKPFSFYRTNFKNDYIRTYFKSDDEFVAWAENVKSRSLYPSDHTFTAEDQILTLSTCINYSYNDEGRYAFHAVLVEVISDNKK